MQGPTVAFFALSLAVASAVILEQTPFKRQIPADRLRGKKKTEMTIRLRKTTYGFPFPSSRLPHQVLRLHPVQTLRYQRQLVPCPLLRKGHLQARREQ